MCVRVCVFVYRLTYVILSIRIFVVEHFEEFLLDESLLVEGSLVLDDFYGHPRPLFRVVGLHHL